MTESVKDSNLPILNQSVAIDPRTKQNGNAAVSATPRQLQRRDAANKMKLKKKANGPKSPCVIRRSALVTDKSMR